MGRGHTGEAVRGAGGDEGVYEQADAHAAGRSLDQFIEERTGHIVIVPDKCLDGDAFAGSSHQMQTGNECVVAHFEQLCVVDRFTPVFCHSVCARCQIQIFRFDRAATPGIATRKRVPARMRSSPLDVAARQRSTPGDREQTQQEAQYPHMFCEEPYHGDSS